MKSPKLLLSGMALISLLSSIFLAQSKQARADHVCNVFYCHQSIPAGPATYGIDVSNNCYKPIRVAIMTYYPGSTRGGATGSQSGITEFRPGKWVPEGWWNVGSGRTARIKNGISNRSFYYYAETQDNTLNWSGNVYQSLYGKTLPFRKVDVSSLRDSQPLSLVC
ncbi:DUF1036 domain-containing protein [Leptolyngbya sp. FACHB-17]|uniref:DUF1036 domain-containing protein n=1 Tax=unclassified Leptolyngbya TaxID=2650499 RepID=UPI00168084F8|nr:DUF1036 domain-containing protein [Leptolyngbya sp. FACHB-17]MBD2080604.1 DUF1036 domain-containing protein [Leptolyngbya sp. FACHB-17]